jgi:hypothetical protein
MQLKKDEENSNDELRLLAKKIASCQSIWTQVWHGAENGSPTESLMVLVQEEHRRNFNLWHEEDKARAPDVSDLSIATVKRAIDKLNQQRNDFIEKLDEHLLGLLHENERITGKKTSSQIPWNSETPGSVIDRLSILSLKVFHMREQTERLDAKSDHLQKCAERLKILTQQHHDLTTALQNLLDDLFAGRKQMKVYRQYKMYNDPDSNPAIYGAKK